MDSTGQNKDIPLPAAGDDVGRTMRVDPTKNVLDLVGAAVQRLDDLGSATHHFNQRLAESYIRRIDDLRMAETRRIEDLRQADNKNNALRAEYHEKLAIAEAKRIDAIRSVDVNAVAVASERATQQASVLANQVAQSADALRTLVATTATTFAQQQQSLQTQITERLALLERSQYENKGKAGVADPMMVELVSEMKAMKGAQQTTTGKSEGMSASWAMLIGAVGLIVAFMTIGAGILNRNRNESPAPPAAPSIIYLQPPSATAPPQLPQPGAGVPK